MTANEDGAVRPDLASARRRRLVTSLVGVVVSGVLLVWTLRDVSFSEVWRHAREAQPLLLLAAVTVATSTFPLRIFRWRLLVRTESGDPIPIAPLWHAIAIGFMANNVLPLRAGEVVRGFSLSRLAPVRITAALSSLVVERLFDGLIIVTLLLIGLVSAGIPRDAEIGGVHVAAAASRAAILCAVLLVVALGVLVFPRAAERVVRGLIPSPRLAERLVRAIEGIRLGLGALASPRRLVGTVVWSFVLWLVNTSAFYLAFQAFDLPVGYSGAMVLQGLLVLGIATPSTPGYIGVFEAIIKAVLALFGVASGRAVAYALTYHITTFLPITLLGLWSLARTPIGLKAAREATGE